MYGRLQPDDYEREIEANIVRAFGWSIIEFEAVLYQKYLHMSGPSSVMLEEEFKKHLKEMHAKGFVSPLEFQRKKAWRKLVIESDTEEELQDEDEIRELLEAAKRARHKQRRKKKTPHGRIVTESRIIAEDILSTLRDKVIRGEMSDDAAKVILMQHIEGMRRALLDSSDAFMRYVRKNIPGMRKPMSHILASKGEDVLLLSLRLIGNE
ncbi:MAG: hypothetical protein ACW985_04550 [Candidatus Thorarchaeota archaeon]|jgi:hypothetical protein